MKNIITAGISLILLGAVWISWQQFEAWQTDYVRGVACTADAKMCPDGSYVGRTGPRCEFAACGGQTGTILSFDDCARAGYPVMESYPRQCRTPDGRTFVEVIEPVGEFWGTVHGRVLLGPTCPVERIPPDPACADKPYGTLLALTTADGARVIKEFQSMSDGTFSVEAPPGNYTIRTAVAASIHPSCSSEVIHLDANGSVEVMVSCDTGIR